MPPHLKKSINQAHLKIGTYEQNVTQLERELELNGLEAPDELPINNVSQQPTNTNTDRPKPTCHHCKKPGHYKNQCRLLRKQREQTDDTHNNPGNKNSGARTVMSTTVTKTETVTKLKGSQKLFTHPVKHAVKETTPRRNATLEPMQPIDCLPGTEDRKDKIIRFQTELIK